MRSLALADDCSSFNADLNAWDVSAVTDMRATFRGASAFNGNIASWTTSSVKMFRQMFASATTIIDYTENSLLNNVFNGDVSGWDSEGQDSNRLVRPRCHALKCALTEIGVFAAQPRPPRAWP